MAFGPIAAVWFDKDGTLAEVSGFLVDLGGARVRAVMAQVTPAMLPQKSLEGMGDRLLLALGLRGDRFEHLGVGNFDLDPSGPLAVAPRFENERVVAEVLVEGGLRLLEARAIAATAFQRADDGLGRKADRTPPFADVVDCVARLHGAGLKLGIVSADRPDLTADFVVRYGLGDRITAAWGSSAQLAKPDPELLRRGCREMGVLPEQVVVVGDSALDVQLARSAGAAGVIGLARSSRDRPGLAGADVVVASLDELTVRSSPHGPGNGPENSSRNH
ncbi:MAG: HAD family hydrolase [Cyanophyceae cyanobacterium]